MFLIILFCVAVWFFMLISFYWIKGNEDISVPVSIGLFLLWATFGFYLLLTMPPALFVADTFSEFLSLFWESFTEGFS